MLAWLPRRLAAVVAVAAAAILPATAGAQWPHLAGLPLRSAAIHVDQDGTIYVVNPDADSVTRLLPAAGGMQTTVWEASVGDYPRTVTPWGDSVLTANQDADTVSQLRKLDGARARPDVPLPFGCAPFGIVGNHVGDKLYVACQGTQELLVFGNDLGLVARIALDWPMPRGVAISANDGQVYVSHFLTAEPNHDAHVSEIDAATNTLTPRRYLTVPADRSTCETQNSGQGVTNVVNTIALTPPDSPAANQLWVGGTLQNNLTKGLFKRYAGFKGRPETALHDLDCPDDANVSCRFESFPRGNGTAALKRNLYKSSFHDITRFVIWKIDLGTGQVVGKIDVDEANHATDFVLSRDGTVGYAVDQMFHSFHVFNALRGQGGNPGTLFAGVARFGPFGADPAQPCDADALGSVTGEAPFVLPPQAQITPIGGGNPIRLVGPTAVPVATGVDFDTRTYHETGAALMRSVPDAVGTAPIGLALSNDGCIAYVANYLARNVVAVSAVPGAASCSVGGQTVDFRCARDVTVPCRTVFDCPRAGGVCNHPGGTPCSMDTDCPPGQGPCVQDNECVPLIVADPVATTALVSEEVPAEILDGKILFNTAARDSSTPNGIGLGLPAPLFNAVRKVCSNDDTLECVADAQCPGGTCIVDSLPGEVTSVAHDASYVTCTACHVDYGGQDGRTWDFSQFGASLRNTMDLRGRSQAAPGTCDALRSANVAKAGLPCHFDAACGSGSAPGACVANPSSIPPHLDAADRARWFNPMLTVHWNGDRAEVEGFEFTYRSLLGAGDCDGTEHDPERCLGALLPRSLAASRVAVASDGRFEGDLRSTLRNVMVFEPKLDKEVNASVRLTHMADFVYSLTEFPRNPFLGPGGTAVSEAAQRGRRIFTDETTGCASCHNGPSGANQLFTDKVPNSGFDPTQPAGAASNNPFKRQAVGTANLFDLTDPAVVAMENGTFQNSAGSDAGRGIPAMRGALVDYVTPVLNDVWGTAPYLHDGSAPALLDVVRPCRTEVTDCFQKGLGRNVDERHGRTAHLTPQQLNDLVAFQRAPHNPVGESESAVRAGRLELTKVRVKAGRRAGRGSYAVVATVKAGGLPVDPVSGGLGLTLAVPGRQLMSLHEVVAAPGEVRANARGTRFRLRTRTPVRLVLTLERLGSGDLRLVAKGRRADLVALTTGSHDLTVALVVGNVQFVENRVLTPRGRGGRTLVLRRQGGAA